MTRNMIKWMIAITILLMIVAWLIGCKPPQSKVPPCQIIDMGYEGLNLIEGKFTLKRKDGSLDTLFILEDGTGGYIYGKMVNTHIVGGVHSVSELKLLTQFDDILKVTK